MEPVEKLSFEAALAELEAIVKRLEEGKVNLEDAVGAYERGAQLKNHCEMQLKNARMRVEKIMVGSDGTITTQTFDPV